MKKINMIVMIMLSAAVLMGCSPLTDLFNSEEQEAFLPEILWTVESDFLINNYSTALLTGDNLYIPSLGSKGLAKVNVSNGELIWQNHEATRLLTQPIIYNDCLIYLSNYREDNANLLSLNLINGAIKGCSILKQFADNNFDGEKIKYLASWLKVYQGYMYFPLWLEQDDQCRICRIELSSLTTDPVDYPVIEPDIFLEYTPTTVVSIEPLFEDDRVYIFMGARGTKASEEIPDGYNQEDIQMGCYDLEGNEIWKTGLNTIGWTVLGNELIQFYEDDYIFLGCSDGLALFNKDTGEVVYEKPYDPYYQQFDSFFTIENNKVYATGGFSLRCFNILNGDVIWEDEKNYTRDCKPIIFNDHVYVVDGDALRYYDKNSGEMLGENLDLGVPGYRSQRYMPWTDDVLYILKTEKVVAVRME